MSTPEPPTLDDAQDAVRQALGIVANSVSFSGHRVEDVYDSGAARHERVVSFTVVTAGGMSRGFTATITADDED